MRRIILSIPITLDGFIEGPNRELDWVIADDELHEFYSQLLQHADTLLYGRVTYELMASYWPTATDDKTIPMGMVHFANTLNPMPKIVFSKTLTKVGWNTQIINSVIPEEIMKMKAGPGRNILLGGGASLVQTFMEIGLVDELQLLIQPVAIGAGKPLFGGINRQVRLDFKWSQPFHSGAVLLCYHLNTRAEINH
jgi:dihydrofolate reductase